MQGAHLWPEVFDLKAFQRGGGWDTIRGYDLDSRDELAPKQLRGRGGLWPGVSSVDAHLSHAACSVPQAAPNPSANTASTC